tara:strand:+ start:322 stop:861 length:540 start_codon:yes stop_codon:yes gene_type:complete
MLQLDGKTLQYDRAFTHNGISYPANWLRLTTLEEKQAIGIVEVPDQPQAVWDQRFYWGVDNPKQLEDVTDDDGNTTTGLKTLWKEKQNEIAASLLAPSDWRVVKASEVTTYTVESEWITYRAAVRTACNTRQTEIDNCADVPALKELLFGDAQIESTDDDGNTVMINNPNLATPWPTEP